MERVYRYLLLIGCLLPCLLCSAQNDEEINVGYRPKIAEISLQNILDYKTSYISELNGEQTNQVDNDRLLKFKMAVPLKLKGKTKLGLQFKYYRQRIDFEQKEMDATDGLFDYIANQRFINTGVRFIYKNNITKDKCLTVLAGTEIKSDHFEWNDNSMLTFLSATYIHKISEKKKVGFGVLAARSLGRNSAYPIFIYENKITDNLTLELILPKSVTLRKRLNNKTFLSGQVAFKGWRYNLNNSYADSNQEFTLRRSDLRFTLSYEREIHDWLWVGVETGYNKNLRYLLTNPGDRGRDAISTLTSKDATFLNFSIFIVPPKKLWGKM